jgi:hypothetical protein
LPFQSIDLRKDLLVKPRALLPAVALVVLLACGKDSTGPVSISGTWMANWSNVAGGGVSCSMGSITLSLTQSGGTFTGAYGSGTLTCSGPGGTASGSFTGGTVSSGTVQGNTVAFNLDTPDYHQAGTVSGNSMSGTATWRIDTGSGVVTLTGTWSATRQ